MEESILERMYMEWKEELDESHRKAQAKSEARAELIAELRTSAPRVLKQIRARSVAAKAAASEASARIYESQRALRKFAERVRDGAFGRYFSWVYFIGRKSDGALKIGLSGDPTTRLRDLQVGSPEELEFVVAVTGDLAVELMLHQAFAPDRIRGEWFRRSKVLDEFIRIVRLTEAKYPDG